MRRRLAPAWIAGGLALLGLVGALLLWGDAASRRRCHDLDGELVRGLCIDRGAIIPGEFAP